MTVGFNEANIGGEDGPPSIPLSWHEAVRTSTEFNPNLTLVGNDGEIVFLSMPYDLKLSHGQEISLVSIRKPVEGAFEPGLYFITEGEPLTNIDIQKVNTFIINLLPSPVGGRWKIHIFDGEITTKEGDYFFDQAFISKCLGMFSDGHLWYWVMPIRLRDLDRASFI